MTDNCLTWCIVCAVFAIIFELALCILYLSEIYKTIAFLRYLRKGVNNENFQS